MGNSNDLGGMFIVVLLFMLTTIAIPAGLGHLIARGTNGNVWLHTAAGAMVGIVILTSGNTRSNQNTHKEVAKPPKSTHVV
jgi:hypothetical protein